MKRPALWLALLLFAATAALIAYRIVALGYPLFPAAPGKTWALRIEAHVHGDAPETVVRLYLPHDAPGRTIVEEQVYSGLFDLDLLPEGETRLGEWTGALRGTNEFIRYRAILAVRPTLVRSPGPGPAQSLAPTLAPQDKKALEQLVRGWKTLGPKARISAVSKALKGEWTFVDPAVKATTAWGAVEAKYGRKDALMALLDTAGLAARSVQGLRLAEGVESRTEAWIEIWNGQYWDVMWPQTGELEAARASLLPLALGGRSAASITGGRFLDLRWSLAREFISQWRLYFERMQRSNRFLDRWSLFRLPPEFEATFRILLLVPIGALMISLLRNVVGFPTFGIFMPVLVALAFRSTGLLWGLGIFGGVLFIGYGARRLLDRLRLLLVPRMSVMVTLVIACFTVLALVGDKYGVRAFMAVGLLPFVILTMTIERFFILVEEAGVKRAVATAAGSAAVSTIAYWIISWESLQLTFFVFPELLAAVAALQILLGRYTGYRLSEVFRFRAFGGQG